MAKIPIILEPGRADGKLIKTNSVYDDNQEKFLSDKIKEIDDNHNTLKDNVNTLTEVVTNNKSDIEFKLETEKTRATNAESNLRETINNITNINEHASTAELITVNTLPNSTVYNVQQALNELFKNSTFAGIATPTTNPGTPEGPVFYFATQTGKYSNFNDIEVAEGEAIILQWNNGTWTKRISGLATEYLNKKLDVIKGVDNTDLTKGYYYDNTNGNKIANSNSVSTLIDIPDKTKEITFNLEEASTTIPFYGIALYDVAVSELTDENISSHFIKGFNLKSLNEVPRIVIDSSYKSIAISSNNNRTIQVIFSPKVSSVKYGSRLIDVFYLNDSSTKSFKGKSLFLRTLNKSTGTISFRDSDSKDYNIFSTKKKGKELLICKDNNYVYLGVLVDWDIVDYDFTDIPQSDENTIVLSTPKSSEGQRIFDMFFNKKYRQTENTIKNGDGVISEYDCVWEDGTAGHVTYTTYDANVLEYRSSIVTYGSNYAVHYGIKTFDEFGNIVSETGLEIRIV